jgi:hypothetical protein
MVMIETQQNDLKSDCAGQDNKVFTRVTNLATTSQASVNA